MNLHLSTFVNQLLTPPQVYAQVDLGEALKLNETDTVKGTFPDLGTIISTILPNLYILAGIILFFLIIFGGFTIVSSGGNPEQTQKGQQTLTGARIGFVIIFASYWIVELIQYLTGIQILNSTIL